MAAGDLRAALEMAGTPIAPYDLLIAAQALRRGTTLVTANVAEFARVPGLLWQDWTGEARGKRHDQHSARPPGHVRAPSQEPQGSAGRELGSRPL